MNNQSIEKIYTIALSSWEKSSHLQKQKCAEFMKMDTLNTQAFCNLFFSKYSIVQEVGRVVRRYLGVEKSIKKQGALELYYSNMFAVKYLQFRGDDVYLKELAGWIDIILKKNTVNIPFNLDNMNLHYKRYLSDIRTFTALNFVCFFEALKSPLNFSEWVLKHSEGIIERINNSIIFIKDIDPIVLMDECLQVVFGMYHSCPLLEFTDKEILEYKKVN